MNGTPGLSYARATGTALAHLSISKLAIESALTYLEHPSSFNLLVARDILSQNLMDIERTTSKINAFVEDGD